MSAAPLEEDLNDAGEISALAIEAVIDLDTYAAIDKVDEPDFVEVLTECDDPDVEDVAADVVFPSNSSLPPCMHLETAECIEERPNLEAVVIPAELETEEVDVPTDEPFGLDDSSASHHVLVCREEPVDTVFEKLSKSSEAVNTLGDHISLDAGHWNSLDSGRADELEAGGDVIQARIPDSGGVWSAVCVLMIAAVIVGMENNVDSVIVEPFAVVNVPMDRTYVDAGRFDLFDDGGGREDELGVDVVLADKSDSIAAIVVGMEKELNDEKKDAEQHTDYRCSGDHGTRAVDCVRR